MGVVEGALEVQLRVDPSEVHHFPAVRVPTFGSTSVEIRVGLPVTPVQGTELAFVARSALVASFTFPVISFK